MAVREIDLRSIAHKENIPVPPDFWQFWHYYWQNKSQQSYLEQNFADFPRYYRLLGQLTVLAVKTK